MASSDRRGRREFGAIRKLPSGRWQASYLDPASNERILADQPFATRAAAHGWLVQVQAKLQQGELDDPRLARLTVNEWGERWLRSVQVRPATETKYASILANHIAPVLGTKPVSKVTRQDVVDFVRAMGDAGAAPGTVTNARRVLSMLLNEAVRSGAIPRNPSDGVKVRRPRKQEMVFLSRDQVLALADAITHPPVVTGGGEHRRASYPEYGLLVRLAAETGMRAGEIAALRVGRVDLVGRRIIVAESATELSGPGGGLSYDEPKTYERRSVSIHQALADELAEHLRHRPSDPRTLVFTAPDGGPLRHTNFYRRHFKPAVLRSGIPPETRFHDLRHTCAALLIAEGAHALAVKQRLGHSSITVTFDRYGHLFPALEEAVTERMEAAYRAALDAARQRET